MGVKKSVNLEYECESQVFCNQCLVVLPYGIHDIEYRQHQKFFDEFICAECNGGPNQIPRFSNINTLLFRSSRSNLDIMDGQIK
jgi:hypothetical protein